MNDQIQAPSTSQPDEESVQQIEFQYEPAPFKILNYIVLALLAFGLYVAVGSFIAWDREGDDFSLAMKAKRFGFIAGCSITFIAFMWLLIRLQLKRRSG